DGGRTADELPEIRIVPERVALHAGCDGLVVWRYRQHELVAWRGAGAEIDGVTSVRRSAGDRGHARGVEARAGRARCIGVPVDGVGGVVTRLEITGGAFGEVVFEVREKRLALIARPQRITGGGERSVAIHHGTGVRCAPEAVGELLDP